MNKNVCFFCLKETKNKYVCLMCKNNNNFLGKSNQYFCGECLDKHMEFHETGNINLSGTQTFTELEQAIFNDVGKNTGLF